MAVEFVFQWIHIFVSIFWFGAVLFTDFVLMPGIATMSPRAQQEFGIHVGPRVNRLIVPAALLSIALGALRGLLFGDIGGPDAVFGTTYGLAWLTALIVAVATFAWGLFLIGPTVERLSKSGSPADATAQIARLKPLVTIELAGFVVVFTSMIVMHYATGA